MAIGATGRSSGLVRMHYDLAQESQLAWLSFHYFYDWRRRVGGDCGFTRTGFLQFVAPGREELLKANVAMHQQIGIPTFVIEQDDIRRLAPYFKVDDVQAAAYEPESGYGDAYAATASFMDAARKMGARLVQECTVTGIEVVGGKVRGVETSQGKFAASIVVNCAGPWAGVVGKMADLEVPLTTWQHDTMMVRRPPELGPSHPTVIDDGLDIYFRPETGGLTLVGLEDNSILGEDPDTSTEYARPGFVEQAIDRLCLRMPDMERGSLQSAHGGYDGLTPDQRPILGAAGPEGFFLQCGMSGTGFKIAPAVGACMAELIAEGESKLMDISPFALQRFEDGNLLKGEHDYGVIWK
jgi:sarcosine oxidase subunit beta